MADFFKKDETVDEPKTEETQQPEKITLGEESYTQEELSNLVGLGKIARESEEKFNRPINKFWPDYTKTKQENEDLKQQVATQKTQVEQKLDVSDLSEDQKALAKKQLFDLLGDEPLTKKEFDQAVSQKVQGVLAVRDLIEDTEMVIEEMAGRGLPRVSADDLLAFMQQPENPKNPEKAYKLMYEKELDAWKEQQLAKVKPQGLETTSTSTAGATREPEKVTLTKDNLAQALRDYVSKRGAQ